MSSIPPDDDDQWRNPFDGRPFVTLDSSEPGIYAVTIESGATLRDMIDVVAILPRLIYIDHAPPTPGDSAVILRFRALPPGLGRLRFGEL